MSDFGGSMVNNSGDSIPRYCRTFIVSSSSSESRYGDTSSPRSLKYSAATIVAQSVSVSGFFGQIIWYIDEMKEIVAA